jgi:transcriptional regulator with XRE-family HTH domain
MRKAQLRAPDDYAGMSERAIRPGGRAAVRSGRGRSGYLAMRLGTALRERRRAAGLTQREVGQQAVMSQQEISHLERGRGADAPLLTWAVVGAVVGLQFTAFFERAPGASEPRDLQHLRGQNLIVATAEPGGWVSSPESLLADVGSHPRSIDVLLLRDARREAAVVELWDLLLDGGAAMRGLAAKVRATHDRLGTDVHVEGLLVVRGTARNRALVRELGPLFAARYPASSVGWLQALTLPDRPMPRGSGFLWTDVAASRLISARY